MKSLITELKEAIDKVRIEGFEVIGISITAITHRILKKELEISDTLRLNELFGVPITFDKTIPENKMWIINKQWFRDNCE